MTYDVVRAMSYVMTYDHNYYDVATYDIVRPTYDVVRHVRHRTSRRTTSYNADRMRYRRFGLHIVYDIVCDVALFPSGGRAWGGLNGPRFICRSVHWQIRFYNQGLPVLLQQPDSIATPWYPIPPGPPRPASPFPPLSGLPRHLFRFARPQPGAACLKMRHAVPLRGRRHCCGAGSGRQRQLRQAWGHCTA